MNLYPAIDIFQGNVVRLARGDFNQTTVYADNPVDMAKAWVAAGAQWIHVVDLEGSKTGVLANITSVANICKAVTANVQFGGGIRDLDAIQRLLELGVSRVVLGTKAVEHAFLSGAISRFGEKVAVALDVRNNRVQTAGWLSQSELTLEEALAFYDLLKVRTIIYTDIDKDGMLKGPNFEKLRFVLENTSARVILSGGIGQLEHLDQCRTIARKNFDGVIIGKALYEKKFTLSEALRAISTP